MPGSARFCAGCQQWIDTGGSQEQRGGGGRRLSRRGCDTGICKISPPYRRRASLAYLRQSRPGAGLGFEKEVPNTFCSGSPSKSFVQEEVPKTLAFRKKSLKPLESVSRTLFCSVFAWKRPAPRLLVSSPSPAWTPLSDTVYILIIFRTSTPPQNRQHDCLISSS